MMKTKVVDITWRQDRQQKHDAFGVVSEQDAITNLQNKNRTMINNE